MVQVPDKGMIYSFNEGNYNGWSEGLRNYVDSLKDPSKWGGKPYTSRSPLTPLLPNFQLQHSTDRLRSLASLRDGCRRASCGHVHHVVAVVMHWGPRWLCC